MRESRTYNPISHPEPGVTLCVYDHTLKMRLPQDIMELSLLKKVIVRWLAKHEFRAGTTNHAIALYDLERVQRAIKRALKPVVPRRPRTRYFSNLHFGVSNTDKYGWVLNLHEERMLASEAREMAAYLTQAANWLDYKNGGRRG